MNNNNKEMWRNRLFFGPLELTINDDVTKETVAQQTVKEQQAKAAKDTAAFFKVQYDAFVAEGFTDAQAMFLITSMLNAVANQKKD